MNLTSNESKIASDVTAPLPVTRGIERTFSRPFSETFRISKNEDFNGPYLENENEFLKNSFETVFRASKSCDRDQLVSAFQLIFKIGSLKTDCVNHPLQFQAIYSNFLTIFYQGRLTVELELMRKHCEPFAYLSKHCEPFHVIKVCQEPFCKISPL